MPALYTAMARAAGGLFGGFWGVPVVEEGELEGSLSAVRDLNRPPNPPLIRIPRGGRPKRGHVGRPTKQQAPGRFKRARGVCARGWVPGQGGWRKVSQATCTPPGREARSPQTRNNPRTNPSPQRDARTPPKPRDKTLQGGVSRMRPSESVRKSRASESKRSETPPPPFHARTPSVGGSERVAEGLAHQNSPTTPKAPLPSDACSL